jgi:hypothetical protein
MEQFNVTLAAAFDLEPARLSTVATGLVIEDFGSPAVSASTACLCTDGSVSPCAASIAAFCACFGDGNGHPCSAPPPIRPES